MTKMFRSKHSQLATLTVLFLLSFTAADLIGDVVAYPFCESDLEHDAEPSCAVELSDYDEPERPNRSDIHIDDCFCCSRCVQYSTPFAFAPVSRVVLNDSAPAVSFSLLLPHQLYRPPRLS